MSQWLRAEFLTARNKPIKHETEMRQLAEALLLPAKVAVVKCKGHEGLGTAIAQGNQVADEEAKQAAGYVTARQLVTVEEVVARRDTLTPERIREEQGKASPEEKTIWKEKGGKIEAGIWQNEQGKPALPARLRQRVFEEAHGVGHAGVRQMVENLAEWWHPHMRAMVREYVQNCGICAVHNVHQAVKTAQRNFSRGTSPGEEIVLDYTDMMETARGFRYVLMCVDSFSGWPEACATRREDGALVVKFLINQYIPRYGFPRWVRSGNGSHFKNEDLRKVEQALGLQQVFGTVYHLQSQGKVERMNQTIKQKLAKICAWTKINWVDTLPMALMSMRCSVNRGTGFTPYELQSGRPFPGPKGGLGGALREQKKPKSRAYYDNLRVLVSDFSRQVQERRPQAPAAEPDTAEWVLLTRGTIGASVRRQRSHEDQRQRPTTTCSRANPKASLQLDKTPLRSRQRGRINPDLRGLDRVVYPCPSKEAETSSDS